jgi:hypothetical protein
MLFISTHHRNTGNKRALVILRALCESSVRSVILYHYKKQPFQMRKEF